MVRLNSLHTNPIAVLSAVSLLTILLVFIFLFTPSTFALYRYTLNNSEISRTYIVQIGTVAFGMTLDEV